MTTAQKNALRNIAADANAKVNLQIVQKLLRAGLITQTDDHPLVNGRTGRLFLTEAGQ